MQKTVQISFRKRIERLNSQGYTYIKLLMAQLALYLVSFTVAIFSSRSAMAQLDTESLSGLLVHFSYVFSDCDGMYDLISTFVRYALPDIVQMMLIFVAGFTMFAGPVCAAVNLYRGASLGLGVGYFLYAGTSVPYFEISLLVFILINVLISVLSIIFSVNSVLFSYEYRKSIGRRKALIQYTVSFLIILGAAVALDLVRCIAGAVYTI